MHHSERIAIDHAVRDAAGLRAAQLRDDAIQQFRDAGRRRVLRLLGALSARLRRLVSDRPLSEAAMWRHAMHDPRIVAEIQAARDHALVLLAAGRSEAENSAAAERAAGRPSAGVPAAARGRDPGGYRTRMPGWAPRLGSST